MASRPAEPGAGGPPPRGLTRPDGALGGGAACVVDGAVECHMVESGLHGLGAERGPIVATSDFDPTQPDLIRPFLPQRFATLGANGFGFSDTRAAARRFFHIDALSMAGRALQLLEQEGQVEAGTTARAAEQYRLGDVRAGTCGVAGGDS